MRMGLKLCHGPPIAIVPGMPLETEARMTTDLHLPARGHLPPTGPVDFVEQYYSGGVGWMLRQRLRWVRDTLPLSCDSVLEIGYGSGVFLYELARHSRLVVGVDIHAHGSAVRDRCAEDGLVVGVAQASGMALPFADASFDAVVIVSALEFMPDPAACLRESVRVARTGGRVIAVTPRMHPWADAVWRVLSGVDPEIDFQGGRERVARALSDPSLSVAHHARPWPLPDRFAPYDLVVLSKSREGRHVDVVDEAVDGVGADEHVDGRRFVHMKILHRHRKRHGSTLS
jgi:SAM-dependent methyltransferase